MECAAAGMQVLRQYRKRHYRRRNQMHCMVQVCGFQVTLYQTWKVVSCQSCCYSKLRFVTCINFEANASKGQLGQGDAYRLQYNHDHITTKAKRKTLTGASKGASQPQGAQIHNPTRTTTPKKRRRKVTHPTRLSGEGWQREKPVKSISRERPAETQPKRTTVKRREST